MKRPRSSRTRVYRWPMILLAALIIWEGGVAIAYRQVVWPISVSGVVVVESLGVYWDPEATENVTEIAWGRLRPAENRTVLVYVRNEGNEASVLTLWTSDWSSPEADTYLTLTWNYTDVPLEADQVIPAELELHVDPEIQAVHDFSFNIGIGIATAEGP